jgi:hypothetical protein
MPETKTETKAAKATKTAKKAKAPKVEKPKREKIPAADLMTFAVRIPKSDSAAFHKAAGPGRASQVARRLLVAFANGDENAFRAAVKEANDARG